jgi:hypothetical protein
MAELRFDVLDVRPEPFAAAPTLLARLAVTEASGEPVHAVALQAQVRVEPARRAYTDSEAALLEGLFGSPDRWGQTLHPFLWTHCTAMVPGFTSRTEVELLLPCSYDLEVAAGVYLHSLAGGEVPLDLLFSGTVFGRGPCGFAVSRVPWDAEARYRLPVRVWRDLMDRYFPGGGWLRLPRETLDALLRFKNAPALASWEDAVAALLEDAGRAVP